MNFHKSHWRKPSGAAGFTLVEAMVAISVLGIGIASTVGALTKFNSIASISRNATGAYSAVMNQIDLINSMSPFNPQKNNNNPDCDGAVHAQIPKDYVSVCAGGSATYDMTTVGSPHIYNNVPVYQDPTSGVIVSGTMTVTVTDISATLANTYQFLVTITYTYLGRNYSLSMSTLRTSDI